MSGKIECGCPANGGGLHLRGCPLAVAGLLRPEGVADGKLSAGVLGSVFPKRPSVAAPLQEASVPVAEERERAIQLETIKVILEGFDPVRSSRDFFAERILSSIRSPIPVAEERERDEVFEDLLARVALAAYNVGACRGTNSTARMNEASASENAMRDYVASIRSPRVTAEEVERVLRETIEVFADKLQADSIVHHAMLRIRPLLEGTK